MSTMNRIYFLYIAWLTALAGTLGSLIMSEVFGWVPCVLCWYQRITLYPLVLIIAIGILRKDKNIPYYILPFSLLGGMIALYHWLLQIGLISEVAAPCVAGISCATTYFNLLGFINIPFLSLISFGIISLTAYFYKKGQK